MRIILLVLTLLVGSLLPHASVATGTSVESRAKPNPKTTTPKTAPAKNPSTATGPKKPSAAKEEQLLRERTESHVDNLINADAVLQVNRDRSRGCPDCFGQSAGENLNFNSKTPKQICTDKWNDFYENPVRSGAVEVRIVFGYIDDDVEPIAEDFVGQQVFLDRLKKPCDANKLVRACGFVQSADDVEVVEKTVKSPSGKEQKLRIRVVRSSYSGVERINKLMSSDQDLQSRNAERALYDGISQTDALFYIGHARGGSGPDTFPAERRANGTINYDYYKKLGGDGRPPSGVDKLAAGLVGAVRTPKIMGFLACNSERWSNLLKLNAPKSGRLLSSMDLVPVEIATAQVFAAVDSILWHRCESNFNGAVNDPGLNLYDGIKLPATSLENFFLPSSSP